MVKPQKPHTHKSRRSHRSHRSHKSHKATKPQSQAVKQKNIALLCKIIMNSVELLKCFAFLAFISGHVHIAGHIASLQNTWGHCEVFCKPSIFMHGEFKSNVMTCTCSCLSEGTEWTPWIHPQLISSSVRCSRSNDGMRGVKWSLCETPAAHSILPNCQLQDHQVYPRPAAATMPHTMTSA